MERLKRDQRGFTIIELMIATTVLSVILLMSTAMMISIGHLFYKGLNLSNAQDNARNITDDVAQHLRLSSAKTITPFTSTFSAGGTTFSEIGYCIGSTRYTAVIGHQIGQIGSTDSGSVATPKITHVLWRDTTNGTCQPLDMSLANPDIPSLGPRVGSDGSELIGNNSRLTAFCLGTVGNCTDDISSPYTFNVGVAYGDADLLNVTQGMNVICKSGAADQSCATAYLQSYIVQRL